jgi:hypothetical protein
MVSGVSCGFNLDAQQLPGSDDESSDDEDADDEDADDEGVR